MVGLARRAAASVALGIAQIDVKGVGEALHDRQLLGDQLLALKLGLGLKGGLEAAARAAHSAVAALDPALHQALQKGHQPKLMSADAHQLLGGQDATEGPDEGLEDKGHGAGRQSGAHCEFLGLQTGLFDGQADLLGSDIAAVGQLGLCEQVEQLGLDMSRDYECEIIVSRLSYSGRGSR